MTAQETALMAVGVNVRLDALVHVQALAVEHARGIVKAVVKVHAMAIVEGMRIDNITQ